MPEALGSIFAMPHGCVRAVARSRSLERACLIAILLAPKSSSFAHFLYRELMAKEEMSKLGFQSSGGTRGSTGAAAAERASESEEHRRKGFVAGLPAQARSAGIER
mmetsp:Transcript_43541/g.114443  ORF Transcript_43541/g.114443 Transcript_43541/m.114443 type:complete len:106 (-) Transcript_43541:350-667(-)